MVLGLPAGQNESTQEKQSRFHNHVDHCLFLLKTMAECKSDATPVILQEAGNASHVGAWTLKDAPRRCKDFEVLLDAYSERKICSSFCDASEIYETN